MERSNQYIRRQNVFVVQWLMKVCIATVDLKGSGQPIDTQVCNWWQFEFYGISQKDEEAIRLLLTFGFLRAVGTAESA